MTARLKRVVLGVAVSAALLGAVLALVDGQAALARLQAADPAWLAASFGVSAVVLLARGLRFHGLCQRSPLGVVVAAVALQNALTRVTPLRLGELSLPYALHRVAGEPAAPALVNLVLVRLVELWILLCAVAVAGTWWLQTGAGLSFGLWLGALAAMTAALAWFRPLLGLGRRLAAEIARRLGLGGRPLVRKALAALDEAADSSARLTGRQRRWLVGGSLAVMGLQFWLYDCLLRACGLALAPAQVVVGSAGAQVAGALPVISVGSLGTHETGWTLAMTQVGVGLTDAVISGLFTQVVTLVFAGAFAPLAWHWLQRARRGPLGAAPDRLPRSEAGGAAPAPKDE